MPNPRETQASSPKPRDGPATVFEADPMVTDIFTGQDGDYFGLVVVTNWPASPLASVDQPYQAFLEGVRSCFRDEDLAPQSSQATGSAVSLPAVYLYPTVHLHVTIAAFVSPVKIAPETPETTPEVQRAKTNAALAAVRAASKLPGWPTEPLRLVVDSAQIGRRAGILLWKDLSGGVARIRDCLREACAAAGTPVVVPGIVHSTFLRFSRVPATPGEAVQEAFRSRVGAGLGTEYFPRNTDKDEEASDATTVVRASTVKLVSESTPYMHIPDDDEHVLWTGHLATP